MSKAIKKNTTSKAFSDHKIAAFIDCSGSTTSQTKFGTLLQIQQQICKKMIRQMDHTNTVYWDDTVQIGTCIYNRYTRPACIFKDKDATKIFSDADIVVFTTDGEINSNDVTDLASHVANYMDKSLFVCVIVGDRRTDIDVSVVAPFLLAKNVICFYHNVLTNDSYIVASRGTISATFPCPEPTKRRPFSLKRLTQARISQMNVPKGYLVISETSTHYNVIPRDFTNHPECLRSLSINEYQMLLQNCIVSNNLSTVRDIVKRFEIEDVHKITNEYDDTKLAQQGRDIISQIVLAHQDNDTQLHKKLRKQLDALSQKIAIESKDRRDTLNTKLQPIRSHWQTILSMIHDIETSHNMYSLENFTSNRATRAVTVTLDDTVTLQLDHTNAPHIDCVICLSKGPGVLWLNENLDLDVTTSDFCIDCPMAEYGLLTSVLVSNPVCANCADIYLQCCHESVFRQPIIGYIPLDWSKAANVSHATTVLCKSLTGSKLLSHVKLLLLSIIDNVEFEWFTTRDYLRDSMVHNMICTDNFSNDGNRVTLIEALKHVVNDSQAVLRQPFIAAMKIIKLAARYHIQYPTFIIHAKSRIIERIMYALVEAYCRIRAATSQRVANDAVIDIMYVTVCGIPQEHQKRDISFDSPRIKKFLGNDDFYKYMRMTCDVIGVKLDNIFPKNKIASALYYLSRSGLERPLATYTNIFTRNCMDHDSIDRALFGAYQNTSYTQVPAYICYNGAASCATKLYFMDKPLFTKDMHNSTQNIDKLASLLFDKLAVEIGVTYGSSVPNSRSAHTCTQQIVAQVLEDEHPGAIDYCPRMLVDVLASIRKTAGEKGNIYRPIVITTAYVYILDFLRVRSTTNYSTNPYTDIYITHKLQSELTSYGMTCCNGQAVFDATKIPKPVLLDVTIDVSHVVSEARAVYESI